MVTGALGGGGKEDMLRIEYMEFSKNKHIRKKVSWPICLFLYFRIYKMYYCMCIIYKQINMCLLCGSKTLFFSSEYLFLPFCASPKWVFEMTMPVCHCHTWEAFRDH